ncbi:GNAT family N-acetyltransferase [Streptomyces spectabilis]|uniref:GNAT family N-acetyltransferase n=1 Tax=Streptomyces spectabilis TaxID=68270 RepID=A0A516RJ43_STRST|nr:GNAT family N-acetyltransferase [Streptomyces spectabilis]QDQ15682.1 GNAT family N-acetyltransferase [Streptomyces spectabilis]
MVPELVRTWAAGWAVSRRTPPPVEQPWGIYLDVGTAGQVGRHVLPYATEPVVRAAAASVRVPDTWLKVPGEPEEVEPWLPEGWVVDKEECGHLMSVRLRATDPAAPDGCTVSVETRDGVTFVRVRDEAGAPAAQGQMVVLGEAAVVDRVVTDEAHRRRGLGSHVMRVLADEALARGAGLGVLGATDDGHALYRTLGWKLSAPLTACVYRP